jgi:hypothetical protein
MTTEFGTLETEVATAVATALSEPKVVGKGIYLELQHSNTSHDYTAQVLITPAGVDEKGNLVETAVIFRNISSWSPRSQWRTNLMGLSADEKKLPKDEQQKLITEKIEKFLKRQMSYDYTILRKNTPIVFELSNIDLTDIKEWKVPASALRRIQKARLSLGFPDKVYTR